MLGGADNLNGELPSYITGANSSTLTEQYPAHDRLARPRVHRSDFPEAALFFPVAVELRLGKIR